MPLLSHCFPYLTKDTFTQECYVKNLLQIPDYIPSLRQKILELVVDRMTKLDVRSPKDEIEAAEEEGAEDTNSDMEAEDAMFPMV